MKRIAEQLVWPLFFLIGVLIFVVTKSIFWGALLSSLRAAWPVLQSWRVIRAVDPVPRRRRILFLFYSATACWRVAASALILIFIFALLETKLGLKVDFARFEAALVTVLAGIVFNTLIGCAAILWALARRQRVWIHPALYKTVVKWARSKDERVFARPKANHVILVIATAVTLPSLMPGLVLMSIVGLPGQAVFEGLGCVMLLLGIAVAICFYTYTSRRIVASTPDECWPEGFFSARRARNR